MNLNMYIEYHIKYFNMANMSAVLFNKACVANNIRNIKAIHSNSLEGEINYGTGIKRACENGHLQIMRWIYLLKSDKKLLSGLFLIACRNGFLDILKWLYEIDYNLIFEPDNAATTAIMNMKLHVLKWINSKHPELTKKAIIGSWSEIVTVNFDLSMGLWIRNYKEKHRTRGTYHPRVSGSERWYKSSHESSIESYYSNSSNNDHYNRDHYNHCNRDNHDSNNNNFTGPNMIEGDDCDSIESSVSSESSIPSESSWDESINNDEYRFVHHHSRIPRCHRVQGIHRCNNNREIHDESRVNESLDHYQYIDQGSEYSIDQGSEYSISSMSSRSSWDESSTDSDGYKYIRHHYYVPGHRRVHRNSNSNLNDDSVNLVNNTYFNTSLFFGENVDTQWPSLVENPNPGMFDKNPSTINISSFPTVEICGICMDNTIERMTSCAHFYCNTCIKKIMDRNAKCAFCRKHISILYKNKE